ncbi:acriflavin resistance protein AcrA [Lysobacter daejeonensis GH1-9]|uniref:Acriflavin resistance protein AcrA n=1 Tax=Lysobacter daejeonensis GH1-9 TaxID=1385517 RepID=A0A0A0F0F8_9GAMM|nr:acriflavin resistance protein AcrA [Lysobacter daejeonensis GH1-9]
MPLLGILAAAVLAACGSEAAPSAAMPAPQVSVATVLSEPVQRWDEFTGRVSAVDSVELRPRVSGYVQRVAFVEGEDVRKGELLYVIDPRPYRAALDQAQAQLERARSEASLAAAQNARARTLIEAKAISREDFESRTAASRQGNAAVRAAEAAVAAARLDLQFTEVRSPIDGRAGRVLVTAGNLAQADATLLTTVVSQDPVYVDFEADERAWLRYGQQSSDGAQAVAHNPVQVGLVSEDGYPHAGTVASVDNQVDPGTGTIRARARIPNPDRVLMPGLFARVRLAGTGTAQALLVDDKAVLTDQDRKYLYVLGADNTAQRRDVSLGPVVNGLRVIDSGLKPGDKVIVNGLQKVFMPGMPVAPKVVAMRAATRTGAEAAVAQR